MATYKVPQDVEADDKLLGPFTFRQFVYLMIVFGLLMVAIALYQLFPLLAIIPIPFMLFFIVLALPIKKDQPMETYLAAVLSFYTKPNKRYWVPGQSESTIRITAPKKVEVNRARNISSDEASHRLSFLADLVDSEGHAIKNASTIMKDEFYAEAYNTTDMFEQSKLATQQYEEHRAAVVDSMRSAIAESEYDRESKEAMTRTMQIAGQRVLQPRSGFNNDLGGWSNSGAPVGQSGFVSSSVIQPVFSTPQNNQPSQQSSQSPQAQRTETVQEASDRIRRENESETYVSLH